ncbi:MAG: fumarylacetoacetate hydrolase family protein [Alphaproteobacteria bacterium]|nr:fumarylacetoacetate hydrolase family protein [Alphaproteobacteria bacterium]
MKFCRFAYQGRIRLGAVTPDLGAVIDLQAAFRTRKGLENPIFSDMPALIEAGPAGLEKAAQTISFVMEGSAPETRIALSAVALKAPLARPARMRCFSVYDKHLLNAFRAAATLRAGKFGAFALEKAGYVRIPKAFYLKPFYYKGNALSISGPEDAITFPKPTRMMDYEMELAAVLGRPGLNVDPSRAMDLVWGYTVFNDLSARDILTAEVLSRTRLGPQKGKDFDTGNAIGPWIVTKDEIPDPYALSMTARVNGTVWGRSSTSGMTHPISLQIAEASRHETLYPTEIICTGCANDGCGFEQLRFLNAGDVVEIEIEKIGTLRNRVSEERC